MNKETMYILMKNSNSPVDELHIFEMRFLRINEEGRKEYCFYPKSDPQERYKCLCKALEVYDVEYCKKKTLHNEDEIRMICANIGRQVCGRCISTLYGDF